MGRYDYLDSCRGVSICIGHKITCHLRFASMMTSERSVDGISKLLSKADSEKLRAAGKREAVNKAEYLGVESRYAFIPS